MLFTITAGRTHNTRLAGQLGSVPAAVNSNHVTATKFIVSTVCGMAQQLCLLQQLFIVSSSNLLIASLLLSKNDRIVCECLIFQPFFPPAPKCHQFGPIKLQPVPPAPRARDHTANCVWIWRRNSSYPCQFILGRNEHWAIPNHSTSLLAPRLTWDLCYFQPGLCS